jgi:hypothetical protein
VVEEFSPPFASGEMGTTEITDSYSESFYGFSIDTSGNVWASDFDGRAVYEFSDLAPSSTTVSLPVGLPPVIAEHLTFNFQNGQSLVGNEVSVTGVGIIYNIPGYKPSVDLYSNTYSDCLNAGAGTITIAGFANAVLGDSNATEILVYNWSTFSVNSQGFPMEPACSTS